MVDRLDAFVTKMALCQPSAYIIVTSLMPRGEPNNTYITNYFNPYIPGKVAAQQALGRRVYFLDMHAYLTTNDMFDALHPNASGYAKMAAAWFPAITNIVQPAVSANQPAIIRATGNINHTQFTVAFNKKVNPASATNRSNYAVSGGLTLTGASLSADQRTVTLTTSLQTMGSSYTVTVNNVADQTAPTPLTVPTNSTASFMAVTPRGYLNNVPESSAYSLVYSLDIPATPGYLSTLASYTVDNSAWVGPFSRVAYYMELQTSSGDLQYVWASMNAFTNRADKLGVPTVLSGAIYQKYVTNMNVFCNVPGVTNGTGLAGNLEFWPSNYDAANSIGIPGASGTLYDYGDHPSAGTYGCMQIHNYVAKQTLLAFNNWGGTGTNPDLGIGNQPTGNPDWTFANNGSSFTVKTLQALVLQDTSDVTPPTLVSAQAGFARTLVTVTFSEPLAATSVDGSRFTLNNGVQVLSATLLSDLRTVYLATTPQPTGAALTLTVTGVRDNSASANLIVPGSSIAVSAPGLPPEVSSNAGTLANGYQLIYTLDIPATGNFNASTGFYRYDQRLAAGLFDRVAYYLELQKADGTVQYLWTSMDAFTNKLSAIGVPTAASGAVYQRYVSNLDVKSNVAGVTNGTGMAGGNLEFWPTDYTPTNAAGIAGASNTTFDFGDSRSLTGTHGSMQIHNSTFGHTLFAMNNWGADGQAIALGIGNQATGNPDWTSAANAGTYARRLLHVLARPSGTNGLPAEVAANVPIASNYQLAYTVNLPVTGSFNTNSPAYYSVDNSTNNLPPFSRIAYYLELQKSGTPAVTQFVWTAMDAFTTDARKIAVPTNGTHFRQYVNNLDVLSNVAGVSNGTGIATGNIEFWPSNYGGQNDNNVPGASTNLFDFGDGGSSSTGGGYGSMQVNNYGATQTVFAVNNFNNNATLCLGIGNDPAPVNGGVDWTFAQNAGTWNVRRILHVLVLPNGDLSPDTTRPTLASATGSRALNQVAVSFSETVSDSAGTASFYTLSNGVTVTGATLLSNKRTVILATTPQTAGQTNTLMVTGVRDRSSNGNLILPGSAIAFTVPTSTLPSVLTNVAEAAGYTLIHQLAMPNVANYVPGGAPYSVDESRYAQTQSFDRVAYCMELTGTNGVSQWAYVSMDAFTTDLSKIGVPTAERGAMFQQYVSNMNVYASANAAVTAGVGIVSGNIEFWPSNYGQANDKGIPNASAATFDFGDGGGPTTSAGHGSMQIHNYLSGYTIMSFSHFGSNGNVPGIGIGNNTLFTTGTPDPDWTFNYNASTYSVKNLYVLAHWGATPAGALSGTLPTIMIQPSGRTIRAKESATLVVQAIGATRYQWRRNGAWIAGATLSWLDINQAGASDAGVYDVLVYGSGSAYTASQGATLHVTFGTTFKIK